MKVIKYLIDEYGEEGFVDWWLSPHTKGELTAVRKAAGLSGPPSGLSGKADSMHFGAMVLGAITGYLVKCLALMIRKPGKRLSKVAHAIKKSAGKWKPSIKKLLKI